MGNFVKGVVRRTKGGGKVCGELIRWIWVQNRLPKGILFAVKNEVLRIKKRGSKRKTENDKSKSQMKENRTPVEKDPHSREGSGSALLRCSSEKMTEKVASRPPSF